jgi:NAD(P)H dehydrogenase (quinone)
VRINKGHFLQNIDNQNTLLQYSTILSESDSKCIATCPELCPIISQKFLDNMILVTGATGGLGAATIDFLLQTTAPSNLAVLVRNPEKVADLQAKGVEVRTGDYNDYDTLVKAFQGVEKLYFVSGSDVATRAAQHQNVVNAAKAAGVGHVVYTSFDRKTEDGSSPIAFVADSHLKTEQWLRESGLHYTLMQHGLYTDLLPMFLGEKVLENGVIYQPAGEGKAAFTLRKDMAEAAAKVLTTAGHENKTYLILAEEALSYSDIAQQLGEVTGKNVVHVSPTPDEYVQTLTGAGVPAEFAGFFAAFAQGIAVGEFERTGSDLAQLIGRKPTSVKAYLQGVYGG